MRQMDGDNFYFARCDPRLPVSYCLCSDGNVTFMHHTTDYPSLSGYNIQYKYFSTGRFYAFIDLNLVAPDLKYDDSPDEEITRKP